MATNPDLSDLPEPPDPTALPDEEGEEGEDDNAAAKQRARERIGSIIAQKWRLEELLGVGGMASVYEARHRNGKRVAIKILHPELALSGDTLRRFLREGYLANAVEHPDVVSVLDDGMTDDGLPYLVMDYLEGESLDGRLERIQRPLQLPDVLSIACSMLDVLHAAHQRGIVHRDLKPDNVFLTIDGRVKVFDFGIARLQDARPNNRRATRTGIAMGTPTFMSREQAHGDLKLIDGRTDIWALGATLFYALTADFPYEARSVAEYMAKLMTMDPRPLRSLAPDVPEAIADVIERSLRHDLARRWQNALDMRLRLIEAAQGAGIEIPPQPSTEGFLVPTAPRIRLASFPDERPSVVQRQKNINSLPTSAGLLFERVSSTEIEPGPEPEPVRISSPGVAAPLEEVPIVPIPRIATPAAMNVERIPPPVPDDVDEPAVVPVQRSRAPLALLLLLLLGVTGGALWKFLPGDGGSASNGQAGSTAATPSALVVTAPTMSATTIELVPPSTNSPTRPGGNGSAGSGATEAGAAGGAGAAGAAGGPGAAGASAVTSGTGRGRPSGGRPLSGQGDLGATRN